MDDFSDYEDPDGSERTYGNLKWAEHEAPQRRTSRRCPGRLPGVSVHLLQLLMCLGLLLLLATLLFQVSRLHQDLQGQNEEPQRGQSAAAAPQKQVLGALDEISRQLTQMNVTLGSLCRPCPWGWESFQGSCYWFARYKDNWASAESTCQQRNAHLVVVSSDSEEKFLQSWEVRHEKRTWIGLSDQHNEATWQWVDGTPLQLSYWKAGEPNNDENEDCVELYNDGWNDDQCNKEKVWICEKFMVPCASLS